MKALIVIEIPEDHLAVTLNDLYERLKGYKCELKPMPKEMPNVNPASVWWGWNKILDRVIEEQIKVVDFAKGWNACLEEITGETE